VQFLFNQEQLPGRLEASFMEEVLDCFYYYEVEQKYPEDE